MGLRMLINLLKNVDQTAQEGAKDGEGEREKVNEGERAGLKAPESFEEKLVLLH